MEVDFATKVQLVTDYYQGHDTIWDKIDISGLTPQQINAMYDSLPAASYTIDRTPSGLVLGRSYSNPFELPVTPGTDFDSNIPGGSYGGGNSFTGNIPANLEVDPTTGLPVHQTAGPTMSGGSVLPAVVDRVSLAVAGVNIGAKLGKAIDSAFYNILPTEWQDKLWALDPTTWSTLCGQSAVGDFFLRTLFGVTGQNQMTGYISEDVLAYYYQMMRDNGFWATGDIIVETPSGIADPYGGHIKLTTSTVNVIMSGGFYDYQYSMGTGEYLIVTYTGTGSSATINFDVVGSSEFVCYEYVVQKNSSNIITHSFNSNRTVTALSHTTKYIRHLNGIRASGIDENSLLSLLPICNYADYLPSDSIFTSLIYDGTISTVPAKPGVSDMTGATQYPPTNITGTTTADVLRELKQQYPDLFTDAITERTLQDDGTVTETTYVPIPWTTEGLNPEEPITLDDRGQGDTDIDTTTGQQLLPTTPQGETTEPPPTGEGSTPEVVPPAGSASSLWAIYNPTQGELNSFGAWLWSSDFVEQLKKLFADPMQAIIGVHKVFVNPPTNGSATIKCGYLDSNVSAAVVSNQYTTLNCGSANLREYFGNVFDYDPYTKISLFLPFIGIVPLNVADVMRGTISVKYTVDVITGACLAEVSVSRDGAGGVLYTYGGSCIVSYPVSSGSYAGVISAAISTAIGVGLGLASGGSSLPIALGMVARGALNAKTQVQHSGQFSGAAGVMGGKKPYLIVSRPQTRVALNVEDYDGLPANATLRIGDCVGFTKLSTVHLIVSNAYDNEIAEIEAALKEGVII